MQRPKRSRRFGESRILETRSTRGTTGDRKTSVCKAGSLLFLRSLGETAPQFRISRFNEPHSEVSAADRNIARSSHLLFRHGVLAYRRVFPGDPYLRLWSGLCYGEQKEYAKAYVEFNCIDNSHNELRRVADYIEELKAKMDTIDMLEIRIAEDAIEKALALSDIFINEVDESSHSPLRIYKIALAFHHEGYVDIAVEYYMRLLKRKDLDNDLSAWLHFKMGEAFFEKEVYEVAREHFAKAVYFNSDHTKAKIYLRPLFKPLNIAICPDNLKVDGFIPVQMDICNEEAWDYYFHIRPIDKLLISMFYLNDLEICNKFIKGVKSHLKEEGHIIIIPENCEHISANFGEVKSRIESEGLSVTLFDSTPKNKSRINV
jgi:tetratricopeptide (TPR) repeat protein